MSEEVAQVMLFQTGYKVQYLLVSVDAQVMHIEIESVILFLW